MGRGVAGEPVLAYLSHKRRDLVAPKEERNDFPFEGLLVEDSPSPTMRTPVDVLLKSRIRNNIMELDREW